MHERVDEHRNCFKGNVGGTSQRDRVERVWALSSA